MTRSGDYAQLLKALCIADIGQAPEQPTEVEKPVPIPAEEAAEKPADEHAEEPADNPS